MSLISKTALKIVDSSRKLSNLISYKRPNLSNIGELMYAPQQVLTKDIVEITSNRDTRALLTKEVLEPLIKSGKNLKEICEEFSISRPTLIKHIKQLGIDYKFKKANTPDIVIERGILQKLIEQNKTMNEIATELNVPFGKVRYYLDKYGLSSATQEEWAVLKRYFTAKDSKAKKEAFVEIDKYLTEIAQEQYQFNRATTFEDCLQDVRLRFMELAEKRENGRKGNILQILRKSISEKRPEIETADISLAMDKASDVDFIKAIQDSDTLDYLLKNDYLSERNKDIVIARLRKNEAFSQIAEKMGLSQRRIIELYTQSLEKLLERADFLASDKYLKSRSDFGYNTVKSIIKKEI